MMGACPWAADRTDVVAERREAFADSAAAGDLGDRALGGSILEMSIFEPFSR
jgi:hypothetical protein